MRIAVLLVLALVYALATQVRLPGLGPRFLAEAGPWANGAGLSIIALGVGPFVSAIVLVEIARLVAPPLGRWAASPENANRVETIVWALALAIAALQGFAVARGIEAVQGAVEEPGPMFPIVVVATIVGATTVLGAAAQMTRRLGAGDGILILFATPMLTASVSLIASARLGAPNAIEPAIFILIGATVLLVVGALASRPACPGALGIGGGLLDPLPALIAVKLSSFGILVPRAFGAPPFMGPSVTMAATATGVALIAVVAFLRAIQPGAPPPGARWPATLATIAVVAGLPLIRLIEPSQLASNGYPVFFAVAALLSVLQAFRPVTRG